MKSNPLLFISNIYIYVYIIVTRSICIIHQLAPQRWQDTPSSWVQKHDVVIAFEERIYDAVIEDLQTREPTEDFKAIHVICLDTKVR